jgi:large subunit ribosomal protein L23
MKISANIIKPIVTEKSMKMQESNCYVFEVTKATTAGAFKLEMKKVYGVDVIDVRSIILPGKKRRMAKSNKFRKTAQRKKMIVVLKEGQKIDLTPKE